jgi:hypothetical protein
MAVSSLKYKSKLGNLTAPAEIDLGGMIPIATVSVDSGGAADVTFTSIPGTYAHLQLRILGQTSRSGLNVDALRFQVNSDTGSNYAWHHLRGDGSATEAKASTTQSDMQAERALGTSSGTSSFGGIVLDILDYANTNKYKTFRLLGGVDANGSGAITFTSGLWQNTNAITSIKLYGDAANFTQYSHFALYGIKRAGV